jgi:nitrogen fixation NifU-like protein
MADLRELYQEQILEHSKAPRNYRELEAADRTAEGYNPLCGDHFRVYLQMHGDCIQDIAFQGSGCAISKASASMMTQSLKGKTRSEAKQLFERFHRTVTGQNCENAGEDPKAVDLGKLAVFAGVADFPARVKCATLAWHTLQAALEGTQQPISTEQV